MSLSDARPRMISFKLITCRSKSSNCSFETPSARVYLVVDLRASMLASAHSTIFWECGMTSYCFSKAILKCCVTLKIYVEGMNERAQMTVSGVSSRGVERWAKLWC